MIAGTAVLAQYAATGDPESFRQLVEAHHGLVRSACARVLRDQSQVDDAVQETFWSLARHAGEVRGNIAGWLHATATNHALAALRSDKARRDREVAAAVDTDTEAEGADAVAWKELRGELDRALAGLDPDQRECVVRHYLLGQHLAAIAADQRCSVAAVHKRVQRGLAQLRRRLGSRGLAFGLAALASLLAGPAQAACMAADPSALPELARIGLAAPRPRSVPSDWPAVGAGRRTAGWMAACAGSALLAGWMAWMFAPSRTVAPPPPSPPSAAVVEEPQGPPIMAAPATSPPALGLRPAVAPAPLANPVASAPVAAVEILLFREDFAGRLGAVTSLPNWEAALGMRRAPDGSADPANPCLAIRASTPAEGAGAPAAFLHADAWFCDLWLRPRLDPAPDSDFAVRYRMRLKPSRGEGPLACFPWFCYRDDGAHPGSGRGRPLDLDERVKAEVPRGTWVAVEAAFRRGREARAWTQEIRIDGVERFRMEFLADRSDIMMHVQKGTVEIAAFAVVRPAATAAF